MTLTWKSDITGGASRSRGISFQLMPVEGERVVAATASVWVDGYRAGSAILVDDRHFLTAWHVVEPRPAKLGQPPTTTPEVRIDSAVKPSRCRCSAAGAAAVDLAVLDLGEQRLEARAVDLWAGRRLPATVAVFGYPLAEAAPVGVWREFTVIGTTRVRIAAAAWDEGAGTFPGHSGGPVVDSATGALVGILTSGSEQGRFDRFLPVTVIEEHWPELARPWLYAGDDARSHIKMRATGQRGRVRGGDLFQGRRVALETSSPGCSRTRDRAGHW